MALLTEGTVRQEKQLLTGPMPEKDLWP